MEVKEVELEPALKDAQLKNLMWVLVRNVDTSNQTVSSWTGFNILIRNEIDVSKDNVGYLPTIHASATEISTANEVLNQVLKIMKALELNEVAVVFDQAFYAKAADVLWKNAKFSKIVLRMGTFHTLCNFLSIIGKRFGSAGLRDIAVESGVIAEGSITGVLEGRKYNRAIRLSKVVYEALLRLAWKGFVEWLQEHHLQDVVYVNKAKEVLKSLCDDQSTEGYSVAADDESCSVVIQRFSEYLDHLRNTGGELAAFWMSCVDMIEVLLALVRASREGNWSLHLAAIRNIIPWVFAYDKYNYSKYLSVYYCQMTRLDDTHPEVHRHMLQGGFSVQLGSSNTFGRVPVDQTIEETANKDTQTPGGTKGFSLKPGAVTRYYVTAEYRSTCLKNLRTMIGCSSGGSNHADLAPSRMRKDEAAVESVVNLLEDTWTNPFDTNPIDLINLSTGANPSSDITDDLLSARTKGDAAYEEFQQKRIQTGQTEFFDRLPKMKLTTFDNSQRTTTKKQTNKEQMLISDNKLFGHMLLVASSRNLNMQDVLKHPLGPLPWSLANSDGTMKKTNKAPLARKLETMASIAEDIPSPSACVIDGMSLVYKMKGESHTFEEVAGMLLSYVLNISSTSERVDVVFDCYKKPSIKDAERSRRSSREGVRFSNIIPRHVIKQWKRILSCGSSKMKLIAFIADQWKTQPYRDRLGAKIMYVTSGEICTKITRDSTEDINDLRSTHEEADTRLLLHCKHASLEYPSVIIAAEDTDVFILCLAFQHAIECRIFI